MACSGSSGGAPAAVKVDDGSLKMPVMGDPMKYINPMYTQGQADSSLSPLAAYQEYKRTGMMPQQMSGYQPFTAPAMQTVSVNTKTPPKPSLFGGLLFGNRGEDDGYSNSSGDRNPIRGAGFRGR